MDDELLKQIVKQLKIINLWITIFGTVILLVLIAAGVMLYKLATFTSDSLNKLNSFQEQTSQQLNVKDRICDEKNRDSLIQSRTGLCE